MRTIGERLDDLVTAVHLTALAEVDAVGRGLGMSPAVLADWLGCRSGGSSALTAALVRGESMPDPGRLAAALGEALAAAGARGLPTPILSLTQAGFERACVRVGQDLAGCLGKDSAADRPDGRSDYPGDAPTAGHRPAVAFYGLGAMGAPLALRLAEAGWPVTVYNRTPAAVTPLSDRGVPVALSPADAAEFAGFHVTALTGGPALEQVAIGPGGFLPAAKPGSVWIDLSTCSRADSLRMAGVAAGYGVSLVDAAMAGSPAQAASGALTFLAGGSPGHVRACLPVLLAMGSEVVHAGDQADGHSLKLLNNTLFTCALMALAETVLLAESWGMGRKEWLDRFAEGPNATRVLRQKAGLMRRREYAGGALVDLKVKDLGYTRQMGAGARTAVPLTDLAWTLYRAVQQAGFGRQDGAVLVEWLQSLPV